MLLIFTLNMSLWGSKIKMKYWCHKNGVANDIAKISSMQKIKTDINSLS